MARKKKKVDHEELVTEANRLLKELDAMMNYHEAIVAALKTKAEGAKREKR